MSTETLFPVQMGVQGRKAPTSEGRSKAEAQDEEMVCVADLVLSFHCLTVNLAAVTEACPCPHTLQSQLEAPQSGVGSWSRNDCIWLLFTTHGP